MQFDDYFDFISPDEIRMRGTRIGIEAVLSEYLDGRLPEEIALNLPPLTLEHVHAIITYYLHHQEEVERYLRRWTDRGDRALEQQSYNSLPLLTRLRHAKTVPARP